MTRKLVRGTVTKRRYAAGSKSDHEAVMLTTDDGEYRLRRQGGNPFVDPELDRLVGKRIEASGTVVEGGSLILDDEVSELD